MNENILSPSKWNSAFRDIIFEYDLESRLTGFASDDGFLAFTSVVGAFSFLPVVGESFFIAGTFEVSGLHVITEVISSTSFVTSTAYDGGGGGPVTIYHVRLPQVDVYVGYDVGESFETELPLTLIGSIMTERNPDNTIRFDVSGYLQSYFENIVNPPISGDVDFGVFNRFRLYFDGEYHDFFYVLYSTITHADLNLYFANTGRWLTAEYPSLKFSCGSTVLTRIIDDVVRATVYGATGPDWDDDDYDPDDWGD